MCDNSPRIIDMRTTRHVELSLQILVLISCIIKLCHERLFKASKATWSRSGRAGWR